MQFFHTITLLLLTYGCIEEADASVLFDEELIESKMDDNSLVNFHAGLGDGKKRMIVKYKNAECMEAMHSQTLASKDSFSTSSLVMNFEGDNIDIVNFENDQDIASYMESGNVEYIEEDPIRYIYEVESKPITERDLEEIVGDVVPFGVNMVRALDVSDEFVGNRKVCVIDTGYDFAHEDLPKNHSNVGGNDNRGNQWNLDQNGHGSHVAGTVAAVQNGRGVVGVNRNGEIGLHIERLFGSNGNFIFGSSLVQLARNCVSAGSNVISMSLGGPQSSAFEESQFRQIFESNDVLVVAAAGNGGNTRCSYPACYEAVMSVAAIDSNRRLASFSQRNPDVEISAPGVSVLSVNSGGGYRRLSGTSMSTPHVSGVAALVWSHHPTRSAKEVRDALNESAEDLGSPGRDSSFGFGLVQADAALEKLSGQAPIASPVTIAPVPPPVQAPVDEPVPSPVQAPVSCDSPPVVSPSLGTEKCQDSDQRFAVNNRARNCAWVRRRLERRCTGSIIETCPVTCNVSCMAYNSVEDFALPNGRSRNCAWVSRNPTRRCRNFVVQANCPLICQDV